MICGGGVSRPGTAAPLGVFGGGLTAMASAFPKVAFRRKNLDGVFFPKSFFLFGFAASFKQFQKRIKEKVMINHPLKP